MIEDALRKQLEPVADRQRRLYLARWLAVCWFVAACAGLALYAAARLWGSGSKPAVALVLLGAALATAWVVYRSRRLRPDYRELARRIEHQHPDLKALLLTAVEQEPQGPDGQLGYMQQQVLMQAVRHATDYDWPESISTTTLRWAGVARALALVFLLAVLSQMVLPRSLLPRSDQGILGGRGFHVTVTPGDTAVELGAPVVVLARFEGELPPSAQLQFGPPGAPSQRLVLTKNLDDPVFGGVIQEVASDLVYHVAYAGKRTRDYTITVFQNPELLRIDARITYPAYTGLPAKTVEDTRQVSVVEGSEVALRFVLNKPVRTARLTPAAGIAPALNVDSRDPNVLTASVTALKSERYELHLADADGRQNRMPPRFVLEVHKNLPPEITPTFPNRDLVVSPLEEVDLEAEVADDYGLSGYGLTYTLVGQASQDIVVPGSEGQGAKPQIQYRLVLEQLEAQPDQLLTYYFWANDIGPDGQPRRTNSDIYFAEVRHFEEIFRESQSMQSQAQQQQQNEQGEGQNQGEQLARLQKQIISATWNIQQQAARSGGIEAHKDDLDVVRQAQADALQQAGAVLSEARDPTAIEALQAATGHMETALDHLTKAAESTSVSGASRPRSQDVSRVEGVPPSDRGQDARDTGTPATQELVPALGAEQSAYQELLKLRDREHQVVQGRSASESSASRAASERSRQQLQQLELTQRENRYEMQRFAQSRAQTEQREDVQVLNRLRDLARRQNEVSERLKEAQAALRQAQNEQERQDALRELKRLRDEQLAALRDVDELQQRTESPVNRQRMAETREQLDETRSAIRQSAEALEQGMTSRAVTSATRAQRQLEQMRDDLQRRTSSQFAEQMRDMRDRAQQLDEQQKEIAREIEQRIETRQKTLADADEKPDLTDQVQRQRQEAEQLIEQMKSVSDEAQVSEPLLSRELYDTLRRANTQDLDRVLEAVGELLDRNFLPQAQEVERRAGAGIERLREGVEEAARSVLGDEAEALRLARRQLDELIRQVDGEATRAEPNRPAARGEAVSASDRQPQARDTTRAEAVPPSDRGQDARDTESSDRPSGDRPPDAGQAERQSAADGQRPDRGAPSDRQAGARNQRFADGTERNDPQGWGGGRPESWDEATGPRPLTGEEYLEWSDALRDVEEMLTERDLREEAARVRDRARAIRAEFKRHGKEPQWDLVRSQVIEPLTELRQRVSDRLAQLQSEDALVPIDRDPVPERFAELIRTYFENLGREEP